MELGEGGGDRREMDGEAEKVERCKQDTRRKGESAVGERKKQGTGIRGLRFGGLARGKNRGIGK